MPSSRVEHLVERLGAKLRSRDLSLTTAESCTGGSLAAAIVSDPAASGMLERGYIVYSVDSKCELLGLDRRRVEQCGGVSEEIAKALAIAALRKSRADLSAAITGFAGPREGDEEVGLVHIAVASSGAIEHRVLHLGDIGRSAVCDRAVGDVLEMLASHVSRSDNYRWNDRLASHTADRLAASGPR